MLTSCKEDKISAQNSSCSHSNSKGSSLWHPSSSSTEGQIGQRTHFGRRSTIQEGRKRPRRSSSFSGVVRQFPGTSRTIFRGRGEDGEEEEENSVEEEESDGTEGIPAPVGASQGTEGPTLAQSNQPVSHKSEQYLLAIMQQMTQIMAVSL
ncbi:hypothetical protein O181_033932 [Austropuccinia psidii MF-1]|uniref:Uncharacterized protein n=1 Tax=Austropuccinia psidii MF-1 TaxID=1389203 RepID=A0A9Q3H7L7_9BASI|nr:hypothetical protein [Austropuccinia psidii MF-1]